MDFAFRWNHYTSEVLYFHVLLSDHGLPSFPLGQCLIFGLWPHWGHNLWNPPFSPFSPPFLPSHICLLTKWHKFKESEDGLKNAYLIELKIASRHVVFPQNGCFACVLFVSSFTNRPPNRPSLCYFTSKVLRHISTPGIAPLSFQLPYAPYNLIGWFHQQHGFAH